MISYQLIFSASVCRAFLARQAWTIYYQRWQIFQILFQFYTFLFYYVTWILNSCQLHCQKWKINLNSFYKQTIWGTHIVKKIHLWAETSYQKFVLSSCCCSFSTHIFFWLIFEIMLTRKSKIEDKICNQQFTFYDVKIKISSTLSNEEL